MRTHQPNLSFIPARICATIITDRSSRSAGGVLGQAKAHGGVLLQTQKMCEDCGAKHAHYGTSKAALLSVEDFAEDGRGFV